MPETHDGSDNDLGRELMKRLAAKGPQDARYKSHGEVARGGMGAIVKVWDEEIRRNLAMKVILGKVGDTDSESAEYVSPQRLARFLEEAQITGQLEHPGIVPVHELGLDAHGQVYFTMKLVKGVDLREIFEYVRNGKEGWTVTRALGVLSKVCEAMSYAHDKGVIHRDLKPANIMVGKFGEVYVMDWGLARVVGTNDTKNIRIAVAAHSAAFVKTARHEERESTPDSPLVTMDGDVVGTPAYMAPEQAKGDVDKVGPRADVYAIGAMLYHLISGEVPYTPRDAKLSPHLVLLAAINGPPKPIQQLAPNTPAELIAICEKAMARETQDRYQDMLALQSDLQAYLEGRVVSAFETGGIAEFKKWVRRNRGMAASIVVATTLAIVGAASVAVVKANALTEILRLSDVKRLEDYKTEAESLWPALPEKVNHMEKWLDKARKLAARLPEHRETLGELRSKGVLQAGGNHWKFEDTEEQWQHDTLASLVLGIEVLADQESSTGTIADIEERLAFARAVEKKTLEDCKAEWDFAIASIANPSECPRYKSLIIKPQIGLVPVGRDPASGLWEFAHLASGDLPVRDAGGKLQITEKTGIVLVLLPGGAFSMGAEKPSPEKPPGTPNFDLYASTDEGPVRTMTVEPFFLSKYEMTQAQWLRTSRRTPSIYKAGQKWGQSVTWMNPVEQVSWLECHSTLEHLALLIPTEAQWEYGNRAGTTTPWWTGTDVPTLQGFANIADKYAQENGFAEWTCEVSVNDGHAVHAPIGSYLPNAFGLHDTIGNVWEWCQDEYSSNADQPAHAGDGQRPTSSASLYVNRGGGFNREGTSARSATRRTATPEFRGNAIGLRPAREITP